MKKITTLFLGTALMLSCNNGSFQKGDPTYKSLLIDEIESIEFQPLGNEVELTIFAEEKWSVECTNDAFRIAAEKMGKEGTHTIRISADANRTWEERRGLLLFKRGSITKEIPVVQPFPYLDVTILDDREVKQENDSINLLWNASLEDGAKPYKVIINSNIDWKIDITTITGDAFKLPKEKGFGDASLTINVEKNNIDKIPYESDFFIAGYMDSSCSQEVGDGITQYNHKILHQNNLRFLLNGKCTTPEVEIDELNEKIKVDDIEDQSSIIVDTELPWSIDSQDDWIGTDIDHGEEGLTPITIFATSSEKRPGVNPGTEDRTGKVILKSEGGAEREISVTQKGYTFNVYEKTCHFDNNMDNEILQKSFTIDSSGPWTIQNGIFPEWMTVDPMSGQAGTTEITVTNSSQNLKTEPDRCPVKIDSDWNSLSEEIDVSQARFDFDYYFDPTFEYIPATATKEDVFNLNIESSGDWSISTDSDWLVFSKNSGRGDAIIQFYSSTVNTNMEKDRTSSFTFTSITHKSRGISLKKSGEILQTKFIFDISVDKETLPAFILSDKLNLTIECSGEWAIDDYPDWLVPEVSSGKFNAVVGVTPKTNILTSKRSGTIKVLSKYNNNTLSVDVSQEGFVFKVDEKEFKDIPPVNAGSRTVSLTCSEHAPWEITRDVSWISIPKNSNGSQTLNFDISNNPTKKTRSGIVTVKSSVNSEMEMSEKITFQQKEYVFDVSSSSNYNFTAMPTPGEEKSIDITSSGNWSIISSDDISWLNFSPKSGTGDGVKTISYFTASNNTSTSKRSAKIKVQSSLYEQNPELEKVFTISQDAYIWSVTGSDQKFTANNEDRSQKAEISISCTGKWEAKSDAAWLSIRPSSGTGNGTVDVSPLSNEGDERSAVLTVASLDNKILTKKFSYKQGGFVFDTSKSSIDVGADESTESVNISCSSSWKAQTSETWITLTKATGPAGKDQKLEFTVEKNTSGEERSGDITVTDDLFKKTKTISIRQGK